MGILSFLFGRRRAAVKEQTGSVGISHGEDVPVAVSAEVTPDDAASTQEASVEEEFAALHRKATEFKDAKQWEDAIACLRKAKELVTPSGDGHTVQRLCRLPLFLQQAGHFDEALAEFQELLDNAEAANQYEFGHQRKNVREKFLHLRLSEIYGHMMTACKRQKRSDLLEIYSEKARFHYGKFTRMKAAQEAAERRKLKH